MKVSPACIHSVVEVQTAAGACGVSITNFYLAVGMLSTRHHKKRPLNLANSNVSLGES